MTPSDMALTRVAITLAALVLMAGAAHLPQGAPAARFASETTHTLRNPAPSTSDHVRAGADALLAEMMLHD